MARVLACVDGSVYAHSVADHAAWAANAMGASVELLQVLGRREASSDDRSGSIVAEAHRQLLERLATLDAERSKLLMASARITLDEARERLRAAGVGAVDVSLRNGDLLDELAAREGAADLVVIGKRGEAADFASMHLGSNLERMVRASTRPMLIASRAFRPIRRALVAFDGRASMMKAVDAVSRSPLMRGVAVEIVTAGAETPEARRRLDAAAAQLSAGGLTVEARFEPGTPKEGVAAAVARDGIDLVVMGAYGHSRLRTLVIGSTTAEIIRTCLAPILVYR